jgi:DNA-binding IscR family transcriptional regulator
MFPYLVSLAKPPFAAESSFNQIHPVRVGLSPCPFYLNEGSVLPSCDARKPCPLHTHWERVRGEYNGMLSKLSIRDLKARSVDRSFPESTDNYML